MKEKLFKLAKDIEKLVNINKIYNANIITELHANENAHSRILRMFLQYDDGTEEYPILRKFIEIPKVKDIISDIDFNKCIFRNEQERIDLLIENSSHAIIIENKIYGAVDQESQLERYIECVINHGIEKSNIFVIYLTKDGEKTVDVNSFTQIAKDYLDYEEGVDNGRFILLNYRYDILPWLETMVLPNCTLKEELLISALKQYIDYLNNILGLRENNQQNRKIMETIKDALEIKSIDDCIKIVDQLDGLTREVNNLRDKMTEEIGKKYVEEPFNKYLQAKDKSYSLECCFSYNCIWICVYSTNWKDFYFKVELDKGLFYGIINKDKDNPYKIMNKEPFINNKFKDTIWWPAWKYFSRSDLRYQQNPEFWHKVETKDFENYLENIFEEILSLLEESKK